MSRTAITSTMLAAVAVALAVTPAAAASATTSTTTSTTDGSAAAAGHPRLHAGWSVATLLPDGAPSWKGQTLLYISPDGARTAVTTIGRTERLADVSQDGRYVLSTRSASGGRTEMIVRDLDTGSTRRTPIRAAYEDMRLTGGRGDRVLTQRVTSSDADGSPDVTELRRHDGSVVRALGTGLGVPVTDQGGRFAVAGSSAGLRRVDLTTGARSRIAAPAGYGQCESRRITSDGHSTGAVTVTCYPTSGRGTSQVFAIDLDSGKTTLLTPNRAPKGFGWQDAWSQGWARGIATERLECEATVPRRITPDGATAISTGYGWHLQTVDVVGTRIVGLVSSDCGAIARRLVSHDTRTSTTRTLLSGGAIRTALVSEYDY